MIGRHFGRTIHVTGTLSAGLDVRLSVPVDCRIHRISAVASNDSDATLEVGISTDTNSILESATIGDSQTPKVFDEDDWASANETAKLSQGDILVLTLDHDGDTGTAAQDVTIDIDFLEG